MTLSSRLTIAFGLSLAVTLALALGMQWGTALMQREHTRLDLSQKQLQTLEALLASLAQLDAAVVHYVHDARPERLKALLVNGRHCEVLVDALVDQNRSELDTFGDDDDDDDAALGFSEEQEECRRLAELQCDLQAFNQAIASRVAAGAGDAQWVRATLEEIRSTLDREAIQHSIRELAEEELESVALWRRQLDRLVENVNRLAAYAVIVAGLICIGAILLLGAAVRQVGESQQREQAANLAKSAFLANMSHEIRTPLNGILGFAQLLMRKPELMRDAEAQQYLLTIHSSGQHLLSLINDILDLSKVEAGRLECRRSDVDVLPIYEEVVSVLRVRAMSKSVSLEFHWHGGVPATIHTDGARLKQILLNLVGNAIKFTDCGGVTVDARVEPHAGGWKLVTRVTDTGIGIPAEQLAMIFEPFRQAEASLTRKFEGTGLGLSISKRLAELLGGDITVQSVPGEGSVFELTIDAGAIDPATMSDVPTARSRKKAPAKSEHVEVALTGRRILVVDDGKTNRDLIRIVLKQAGAEVTEAENGLQAVKLAVTDSYDAILIDVQMPVMDGLTATQRLRQQGYTKPILALTAHAMEGDRRKCLEAGCSGYLSKPLHPDDLLSEVGRQLGATVSATAEPAVDATTAPSEFGVVEPLRCSLPTDEPEFLELARAFVDDFQKRLVRMAELRRALDWDGLAAEAHYIKGAGGTAGFEALTDPAAQLERAARTADSLHADMALGTLNALSDSIPAEYLSIAELAR